MELQALLSWWSDPDSSLKFIQLRNYFNAHILQLKNSSAPASIMSRVCRTRTSITIFNFFYERESSFIFFSNLPFEKELDRWKKKTRFIAIQQMWFNAECHSSNISHCLIFPLWYRLQSIQNLFISFQMCHDDLQQFININTKRH